MNSNPLSFEIHEGINEEIIKEQERALGTKLDYDGSKLTLKQRQAIFLRSFAFHLKDNGLRSPRYYEDKSQCLSISETAWPGAVGYLKADRLKKSYIEPEDLIQRLRKLKPSDNFELRNYRHPPMSFAKSPMLGEAGVNFHPSQPQWLADQLWELSELRRSRISSTQKVLVIQAEREANERWAKFVSDVEMKLTPAPDLHLLRDIGHSPCGTLFPWYLVKGLKAIRSRADDEEDGYEEEEHKKAKNKREEAIDRWREKNPDKILADDSLSIYRTWPADLMDELDAIDEEAIRCVWEKYTALLRETEKEMQALVAFWRDCRLVTGQRTPPSSGYPDPKAKAEGLPKPQYLKERLDAIRAEVGYFTDEGKKLRMIEISQWKEAIINGDSEPTASDTPLPQSLLDELNVVWQERDRLDADDTEDEMIARIREWRKPKREQRARSRKSRTKIAMAGDQNIWQGRLRPKTSPTMTEDQNIWKGRFRTKTSPTTATNQTIWQDSLRLRPAAVRTAREKSKAANRPNGKPKGVVKRSNRKASKKKQQAAAMKSYATEFSQQKADMGSQSSTIGEATSEAIPARVTKSRGTRSVRRQAPCQARAMQPQGVRKAQNSKARHPRGFKQELARLLTPPQSPNLEPASK